MNPITIEGITPSARLREQLAAEGRPALLAFSGGKDSIAAWCALQDAGLQVVPYHMYRVPGLAFTAGTFAYFEDHFATRIIQVPHPALYGWLALHVYQPPERFLPVAAARVTVPKYREVVDLIREDQHLPDSTWACDGVRAHDSLVRRAALTTRGPVNQADRKMSVIWDWTKAGVFGAINQAGIRMPVDYQWFKRSFDGIDHRFLAPLAEYAPDDFARLREWLPLADLELYRAAL